MNLCMKQNQNMENRLVVATGERAVGEGRAGSLGLAGANWCIRNGLKKSPAVWYRELYSVSCDKPYLIYICIHTHTHN